MESCQAELIYIIIYLVVCICNPQLHAFYSSGQCQPRRDLPIVEATVANYDSAFNK